MKSEDNPYHTPSYSTEPIFDCILPLKTVSEANLSEHWTKSSARHKKQKLIVRLELLKHKPNITIPCKIYLTRIAPRKLDSRDNLRMSFKWIVDAICDYITPGLAAGRSDDNDQIDIHYFQEKGKAKEYAIRIQIY